ncbi:MAG: NADH:ubiquinone oxidoreductase subunit L [Micavibrio sp.]|nr:MAG: NADH:ubiquinone oxidoreductase subunit L [Micavibrio sp.]
MELLAVFPPLFGFLIAALFGKQIGDKGAQFVTCAGMIVAALAACSLFFTVILAGHPYTAVLSEWITSGDFNVSWALRIDQLSVVMMCVVNIVSACVHVYSVGYMGHDDHKARFMAYLSLFTFAMLMLVSADNLLQLFFGWEGVGLCSYLLIGFWNHKHSANAAAVKAFVVNRIGDFGLALGTMAAFVVFGSVEFDVMFEQAGAVAENTIEFFGFELHALTLICLLLFMGAMGKSAQLGLHTWLPDAMEGPTPVSALIHAATMVTAGVFLVARMSPVFEYAPDALMVVAVVGASTAFVAATIGMTQFDIKRVIAYSTMSQLGYMFFALGVSAYSAAIFHLMTHAFFKALLFLGAGSVIHAMSNEQDMRKMGGLYKKIPVTYALMWVGSLALAGIPPFAGYFSKDIVLEAAWADHTWFGNFAYWAGIAAAFMTAFYSWRLILMTFHGPPRAHQKVMKHIHESPAVMLAPLFVLATGAVLAGFIFYGGFVGGSHHGAESGHEEVAQEHHEEEGPHQETFVVTKDGVHKKEEAEGHRIAWDKESFWGESLFVKDENDTVDAAHGAPFWVKKMPLLVGLLGIGLGYLAYMFFTGIPVTVVRIFKPIHTLLFNKWFFDELYDRLFVKPAFKIGNVFWVKGDQNTIDRLGPDGIARKTLRTAGMLSRFQSGYVYQYALVMMIAVIGIVSWFVFRGGYG